MALETMPLTSSSKIDRMALKALYQTKRHELQIRDEGDAEEDEDVEDSLGQTRKGGQDAKAEQRVIRDLYVFGCVGIVISHWAMYEYLEGLDYYGALTLPAMCTLGSIGRNIWHSQIFAVLCGYSDGVAGQDSFASLGVKYQIWFVLILSSPWLWGMLEMLGGGQSWPTPNYWPGPRIYLVVMFQSRLFMMALFKLRVPRWLMLVLAFPFAANLSPVASWVHEWTQAQGRPITDIMDGLGISMTPMCQVPRYVMDYVVGVLAVPAVRALWKTTTLSLSDSQRKWMGVALWVFFGLSSLAQAFAQYFQHQHHTEEDAAEIVLVLPGVNIPVIQFGPNLLVAWFRILLLAGALTCLPLTGVPASAKTSFLAAFLLSGQTLNPHYAPFDLLKKMPFCASLQMVFLAAYFVFFLSAAAVLQLPIDMGVQLLAKKSNIRG